MRIAIFTFESPQGNLITERLLRVHGSSVCGIVRATTVEPVHAGWRRLAIARRAAPRFLAWKLAEQAVSRFAWVWARVRGRRPAVPTLAALAAEARVPIVATRDVNAAESLAAVRAWRPEIGVSVHFTHRFGAAVLAIPPRGVLNVHGALLPRNRGLFPYFWELANGDKAAGVTVHWVDGTLDTGDVVVQRSLAITSADTVSALSWKGAALGADLVDEALAQVAAGTATRTPQAADGSYFSWPTRGDLRRLRARDRRLGSLADPWRRIVGSTRG